MRPLVQKAASALEYVLMVFSTLNCTCCVFLEPMCDITLCTSPRNRFCSRRGEGGGAGRQAGDGFSG